jgi:hypothetical protein|tara:strand:- start:456 stop:788 length:333 start_codon:yes stop_codon:yes gene_type:complete
MSAVANLYIDQGTDFSVQVDCTDTQGDVLNLTGYTATAQIRKTYGSSNPTATFSCTHSGVGGVVTMQLTDTVTAGIAEGRYVYDLIVQDGSGLKSRIVEGQAIITPSVTR